MAQQLATTSNSVGQPTAFTDTAPDGLNPAEPTLHVDPTEATKELRELIKNLQGAGAGTGVGINVSYHLDGAMNYLNNVGPYLTKARSRAQANSQTLQQIRGDMTGLLGLNDELVRLTRSTKMHAKLSAQRDLAARCQNAAIAASSPLSPLEKVAYYVHHAKDAITLSQQELPSLSSPNMVSVARETIKRMHILVQALPAWGSAYMTPAENVLHAISVIIKNNGYDKAQPNAIVKPDGEVGGVDATP